MADLRMCGFADGIYNFRFLGFCRLSKTDMISIISPLTLKKIDVWGEATQRLIFFFFLK